MVTEVLLLGLGDKGDVLYDLLSQVDCLTCTIVQDYIQVFVLYTAVSVCVLPLKDIVSFPEVFFLGDF